MHYGIGRSNDDMLTAVIIITEEEVQDLRAGKTAILRFREGTPLPFDVQLQFAATYSHAKELMDRNPPVPGCRDFSDDDYEHGGATWIEPKCNGVSR